MPRGLLLESNLNIIEQFLFYQALKNHYYKKRYFSCILITLLNRIYSGITAPDRAAVLPGKTEGFLAIEGSESSRLLI